VKDIKSTRKRVSNSKKLKKKKIENQKSTGLSKNPDCKKIKEIKRKE
jgi:hypothetical protein